MKNLLKRINSVSVFSVFAMSAVIFAAPFAYASDAAIFLSPITGTYPTGSTFTLAVMVGSGGEAVNAIEGKLEYDPKEIEVISTDKSTSVLTSWTVDPTYSNDTGELSFAGLLSTSTVLLRGEVLKFSVKSLRTGELHIRFASGAAVHAADGTGGNILSQLSGGVYVTEPSVNDPTAPSGGSAGDTNTSPLARGEVLGAATGTTITSTTHPDQASWYATSTAVLDWSIPAGTQSIRLSLDKHQSGEGTNVYPPDIHEKIIRDIKDGVWYFHLTRILEAGVKDTTSYRIAVDTVSPSTVVASEVARDDASEPNVKIELSASDTTSGVDHYAFQLDQSGETLWIDDGTHKKSFTGLTAGTHDLAIFAVDKAGNRSAGHLQFNIENLPTPSLAVMNSTFIEGDKLRLNITSVPNATLDIHVARANSSPATEEFTVDAKGKGIFESGLPLAPGSFAVSAIAHSANGALSKESESIPLEVNSSFMGVMKRHPMIPVALLGLLSLLILSWYFWRNVFGTEDINTKSDVKAEDEDNDRTEIVVRETPPSRGVDQGAVVLMKKKKVEMPATRL